MTSIRSTADTGQRLLELLSVRQQRTFAQLSSGLRIATAADDAAGLAIAKRLEAEVRGLGQGAQNLAYGQDVVQVADGALETTADTLGRLRELTVQAQNGTLSAEDRQNIQQEYDQLTAQLDQTANGTAFGGRRLLDGSASGSGAIEIGDGTGNTTRIEIGDARAASLGVAGLSVGDPSTRNALDAATDRVSAERARLGAADNTLSRQQSRLGAAAAAAAAARSRIEDLDVARAASRATRDRILGALALAARRRADQGAGRQLDLLA